MTRRALAPLALATTAIALTFALPAAASADQALTVEKAGPGSGALTSNPSGISCGATCNFSFPDATAVTLTAAPGPESSAPAWTGCDHVNGEGKCEVTMSAAKTVKATFGLISHQLTVARAGVGTGTVSSSPAGINCPSACTASYLHGTTVTLTGTPTSPHGAPPTWTGCGFIDAEDRCEVTMSAAKEVKATFNLERHKLTVFTNGTATGTVESSPAGIKCGGACSAEYEHGATVTLTATPGPHAFPARWAGCDSVSAEDKCVVALEAARSVSASFDLLAPLTVTKAGIGAETSSVTSSPAGIACGAACSAPYSLGTLVTLTGNPGPNTKAAAWANCPTINKEGKCVITMSEARSLTATFEPLPGAPVYPLAIAKAGTGEGTVTGSPGQISCGAACEAELIDGAVVSLSAAPAPGSVFEHWSGGGCSGAGACFATLKGAKTVTATFALAGTRMLTIQKTGTGQGTVTSKPIGTGIDCGQTCSFPIAAATKVILTAKAAKGSSFGHWSGACQGTAPTCALTMSEAKGVGAAFGAPPGAAASPPAPAPKPRKCRKGFKKKRVHGKARCVKAHNHKRHPKRGASPGRG